MDFKALAQEIQEDVVCWRHDFHAHPELSAREYRTSQKIAEILREIGYENVHVGLPGAPEIGVTADLNPGKPGKCIALRSDIDALPVCEETGLPYASENPGVMHACGHDAHMAMLLGAAKLLFQIRDQINGNIRLIFQPCEEDVLIETECLKSGAQVILDDTDIMDGVDAIFALHVWGSLPTGAIYYAPGPFMTANAAIAMEVRGVGGHGALPQNCVDPVVIACQIVSAWQTIVSREVSPLDMAVLSIGGINVEDAVFNVIPEKVSLVGGVRTYGDDLLEYIEKRMKEIAEGIAHGMRAEINFEADYGGPAVINDETFTEQAADAIRGALGEDHIKRTQPVMPSEDFAWYQKRVPGAIFFLGVGDKKKGTDYPQHHVRFNADDDALPVGVASLAAVAYGFLNQGN